MPQHPEAVFLGASMTNKLNDHRALLYQGLNIANSTFAVLSAMQDITENQEAFDRKRHTLDGLIDVLFFNWIAATEKIEEFIEATEMEKT